MSWSVIAPILTAVISLIVAILAHLRASRAQHEQTTIDRAAFINKAYKDVLSELRHEVERLQEVLSSERGRHDERSAELRRRISHLEEEVRTERDERIRLEDKVGALELELSRVEKRQGFYGAHRLEEGDTDGST